RPDLRPRIDTDLVVPPRSRAAAAAVLERLGYTRRGEMSGTLVTSQAMYGKRRNRAVAHAVDVHLRIGNPQLFADVLSYDELADAAIPIPNLHAEGRGPGNVHSLLLACVHRVAHHGDPDHLIWLYDIALLAGTFDEIDWDRFLTLAFQRKVASVCRRSLERAVDRFGARVPAAVWSDDRLRPRPDR